jgi:hypothetical protein
VQEIRDHRKGERVVVTQLVHHTSSSSAKL